MSSAFDVFGPTFVKNADLPEMSRFETYEKGEVILNEHDASDSVFFILTGKVKVTNYSEKGREVWHYEFGPGKVFGEIVALTGSSRIANIEAQQPTKVAILSKEEFLQLIRHDSEIALWLLRDISSRLTEMTRKVNDLVSKNVHVRIHREILQKKPRCPGSRVSRRIYQRLILIILIKREKSHGARGAGVISSVLLIVRIADQKCSLT